MQLEPKTLNVNDFFRLYKQAWALTFRRGLPLGIALLLPLSILGVAGLAFLPGSSKSLWDNLGGNAIWALLGMASVLGWTLTVGGVEHVLKHQKPTLWHTLWASLEEWRNHGKLLRQMAVPSGLTLMALILALTLAKVYLQGHGHGASAVSTGTSLVAGSLMAKLEDLMIYSLTGSMGLLAWFLGLALANAFDYWSPSYWLQTRMNLSRAAAKLASHRASFKNRTFSLLTAIVLAGVPLSLMVPFFSGIYVVFCASFAQLTWMETFGQGPTVESRQEKAATVPGAALPTGWVLREGPR